MRSRRGLRVSPWATDRKSWATRMGHAADLSATIAAEALPCVRVCVYERRMPQRSSSTRRSNLEKEATALNKHKNPSRHPLSLQTTAAAGRRPVTQES
jgi:hypothetical protein